jgi:hypothetical protein
MAREIPNQNVESQSKRCVLPVRIEGTTESNFVGGLTLFDDEHASDALSISPMSQRTLGYVGFRQDRLHLFTSSWSIRSRKAVDARRVR